MDGAPISFLGESCPTSVGDPITTYNGVSTRYWLPEGTELELFRLDDIAVMGTASRTPGYDSAKGEWLHVLRITRAGEAILTVAVNHTANLTACHTARRAAPCRRATGGASPLAAGHGVCSARHELLHAATARA